MRRDGIQDDLRSDVADASFARLESVPDYPQEPTEVELTWRGISEDLPVLKHQMARIALRYSGNDAELRGKITSGLVSLYVILRDAHVMADFQEELGQIQTAPNSHKPFNQDVA